MFSSANQKLITIKHQINQTWLYGSKYDNNHTKQHKLATKRCFIIIITLIENKQIIKMSAQKEPKQKTKKVQQLIKQLMKVWATKDVEQNYQNYYLTYLDSLPQHLIQLQISRQIKKTLQNKSHYFNISKALALHSSTIAKLKVTVDKVQHTDKVSQYDLQTVCQLIDELRSHNMLVAENTLNFNYESSSKSNSQFGFVHGNNYIFQKINIDHSFLKTSFLRKYIVFTHSYDPFFLYHYQTAKTTNDNRYKRHPCIQKLFNLSISKAYKVMKLQQQILQFLSGKIPSDRQKPKKVKRHNYSLINDKNQYQSTIRQTDAQNVSTKRLKNRPYVLKGSNQPQQEQERQQYQLQRSKTDGDSISQYFGNGIGASKTSKKKQSLLPQIKRRQSMANSNIFNPRKQKIYTQPFEQDQIQPITINKSRKMRNSISIVRRKDKQSRNQIPLKYSKFNNINQHFMEIQKDEINQMRTVDYDQDSIGRNQNNRNMVHYSGNPLIEQNSIFRVPPSVVKNFKLKAGNLTVHSFFIFLKQLNVKPEYRKIFEVGNWQHAIKSNQYYLHKFYVNQVLLAISLSCALPEGDIVIKYWAPLNECQQNMSNFLFRKYLQHVEKQTICRSIFYNAVGIKQLQNNDFQQVKQRIFKRQRKMPIQMQYYNYYPFLSCDFSCVALPRSTTRQIQQSIINPSNVYTPFTQNQFFCFNYLLIVNKLINPGHFSQIGSFSSGLASIKDVQTRMLKHQLFSNPYNSQSEASRVNLLTLKMRNPIFSAYFIANRPFIKFTGKQICADKQSLIVSLPFLKNNTTLYFGKGFNSFGDMMTALKNRNGSSKMVDYCVRMFSKRMRGKIHSINLKDEVCFGDLQITFEWRDFLKGRIQHNFDECQMFGDKSSFYCLLQVEQEPIFVFDVNEGNYI